MTQTGRINQLKILCESLYIAFEDKRVMLCAVAKLLSLSSGKTLNMSFFSRPRLGNLLLKENVKLSSVPLLSSFFSDSSHVITLSPLSRKDSVLCSLGWKGLGSTSHGNISQPMSYFKRALMDPSALILLCSLNIWNVKATDLCIRPCLKA